MTTKLFLDFGSVTLAYKTCGSGLYAPPLLRLGEKEKERNVRIVMEVLGSYDLCSTWFVNEAILVILHAFSMLCGWESEGGGGGGEKVREGAQGADYSLHTIYSE